MTLDLDKAWLVAEMIFLIMFGFLLQWPTLLTLVMFPILVYIYVRLARREEAAALEEFGDRYGVYMPTERGAQQARGTSTASDLYCSQAQRIRDDRD